MRVPLEARREPAGNVREPELGHQSVYVFLT